MTGVHKTMILRLWRTWVLGASRLRRFTRLTNAFSKKLTNLRSALALHFAYYNSCRIHGTLRVTPAMAAGLTNHVWELSELVA
jgi:hypothetical protein